MSNEGRLFFDEHYARIQEMIDAALRDYKPVLSQATGELNPTRYPTPTGTHPHPWSAITGTPATLSGYGIVDAQPLDSDLTAIAGLSTTSYGRGFLPLADAAAARSYIGVGTGTGTVTSIDITAPAAGITASGGPITTSGAITLTLANDLAALEGLGSTGLAARTAADTWAQRTIAGTSARVAVTNGDGVAGNPTINIDSGYVGQASITTLGTIGAGTWQGTKIGLTYGGTNADLSGTGGAGQYLKQASAGAAITVGTIPFSDIASLPTTLAGYTITDAQPLDSDLTAIAALTTTSYGRGVLTQADATATRSYIGAGTGSGSVTSVDMTVPAQFTISGNPVTASGTLALAWATVAHSLVLAGPASVIASPAAPTFRQLVQKDMPVNSAFFDTDNAWTAVQTLTITNSVTTAISDILTLIHDSSGTPAASFGTGVLLKGQSDTTADQDMARIASIWTTATHASRTSAIVFQTVNNAGAVAETARLTGPGACWLGKTSGGLTGAGDLDVAGKVNIDGTFTLSATGGAGQYLKQASAGAAITVSTIPYGDLTYSSLTAGQALRATGASAAAFGALDLANTSAVTGILPAANGGTGINNSTRTLTITTNGGTLAFSAASSTFTIPATGTAALLGTAQTFSENNTFQKVVRAPVASGTTGYGIRLWDGTTDYGNWQGLDLGGVSYIFFGTNRQYDGSAWQQLNTRVGGILQITGDALGYYVFPASSSTPTQVWGVANDGTQTHILSDATTGTAPNSVLSRHNTSATLSTITAGFGLTHTTQLDSTTTANQTAATDVTTWATPTHASRKARRVWNVYDTAAREAIRIEASGSAAMIGLYGVAAVARAAAITAPTGGAIIDTQSRTAIGSIITALQNIGITS